MGQAAKKTKTNEEIIDDLRAEHGGRIAWFETPHGLAAFKSPTLAEYQRFLDRVAADKSSKAQAMLDLAYSCRVYPLNRKELSEIFEQLPGIATSAAGAALDLAGANVEAQTEKS